MTVLTGLMKFLIIKWHWTDFSIVRFCKVLEIFLPHEEEEGKKEGKKEGEEEGIGRRRRNEWERVSGVVAERFCSGLDSRKPCHMMTRHAHAYIAINIDDEDNNFVFCCYLTGPSNHSPLKGF